MGARWSEPGRAAMRWLAAIAIAAPVAAALAGCSAGDDPNGAAAPPDAGAIDAGGCAPGTTPLADGGCLPPGVPPDGCAAGFESDHAGGCVAVLPASPCPNGTFAVPGETECHEVMPCGEGPWGEIPIEPGAQFVDASFAGASYGTAANPWRTVQEAVDAADDGEMIAITDGTYVENVVVTYKAVRVWGRCPERVTIVASPAPVGDGFALAFGRSDGSEVHGLALTGDGFGLVNLDSVGVAADRIWVHDTSFTGIEVQLTTGKDVPTLALTRSLIERAVNSGLTLHSASATVERTAIRDGIQLPSDPYSGRGILVQSAGLGEPRSELVLEASLLERNLIEGVFVNRSAATIEGCVIRETLPTPDNPISRAVFSQSPDEANRSAVTVRASVLEHNGISTIATDTVVDRTVVRHSRGDIQTGGPGISVSSLFGEHLRGAGTISSCLVEDAQLAGIFVSGSDVAVDGTLVRGTIPVPGAPHIAAGLWVYHDASDDPLPPGELRERGAATVTRSVIEESYAFGVLVSGGDLTFERSESSRNLPRQPDGFFGRGLQVQNDEELSPAVPSSATVRDSVFADNFEAGISIAGAAATVEGALVRDTRQGSLDGELGDGIVVFASGTALPPVHIRSVELTGNARAGVASIGAHVTLAGATIRCNGFDLGADSFDGQAATFDDQGGNVCGCGAEPATCKALSANLSPPGVAAAPPADAGM